MASGILGIGLTGLYAAQAGIRTTEHNISNVNTAGYRRQEVGLAALQPMYGGTAYFGGGVAVETVRSLYSQFLDNEVLMNQTQLSRYETYAAGAGQIDQMLGDANSGLSGALDKFFGAVNELATDATSGVARQVLISAGNNLAGRINTLDSQIRSFIGNSNNEVATLVGKANLFASQIASLNSQIARAEAASSGLVANDLRDQRQQLIAELNRIVNVSAVQQSDGYMNIYVGSGQALVVGPEAYALSTGLDPNNSALRVPTMEIGGATLALDGDLIQGGQLGGLLAFREEVLLPAQRDLDRIAFALADQFNTRHAAGFDAAGVAGGNFFSAASTLLKQPVAASGTTGTASVALASSSRLVASDYSLGFDGASYTVLRLSDGASATYTPGSEVTIGGVGQGFSLNVAGAVAGDRWSVRPLDGAARGFAQVLKDPAGIAAAGASADAPGDNSNALLLAALRLDGGFGNGVTFNTAYSQAIGRTASLASAADLNQAAFTSLVSSAQAASRAVSGVNLDEEAVNLIRFQQAYQASARAIQIAASLFDEVLGIVR